MKMRTSGVGMSLRCILICSMACIHSCLMADMPVTSHRPSTVVHPSDNGMQTFVHKRSIPDNEHQRALLCQACKLILLMSGGSSVMRDLNSGSWHQRLLTSRGMDWTRVSSRTCLEDSAEADILLNWCRERLSGPSDRLAGRFRDLAGRPGAGTETRDRSLGGGDGNAVSRMATTAAAARDLIRGLQERGFKRTGIDPLYGVSLG